MTPARLAFRLATSRGEIGQSIAFVFLSALLLAVVGFAGTIRRTTERAVRRSADGPAYTRMLVVRGDKAGHVPLTAADVAAVAADPASGVRAAVPWVVAGCDVPRGDGGAAEHRYARATLPGDPDLNGCPVVDGTLIVTNAGLADLGHDPARPPARLALAVRGGLGESASFDFAVRVVAAADVGDAEVMLFLPLADATRLYEAANGPTPGVSRFIAHARGGDSIDGADKYLRDRFARSGYKVVSRLAELQAHRRRSDVIARASGATGWLTAAAWATAIVTLTAAAAGRAAPFFGWLGHHGATPAKLRWMSLCGVGWLMIAGVLIGSAGSWLICRTASRAALDAFGEAYGDAYQYDSAGVALTAAIGLGIALSTAVLAQVESWLKSVRRSRQPKN